MTRILHCISSLGGGGAERQLVHLSNQFVGRGWGVDIALIRDGAMAVSLDPAVSVHRLHAGGNYDPRIYFRLVDLMRELRPDIVQTWLRQMDVMAGAAALWSGIPYILSERTAGVAHRRSFKNSMRRFIGSRADAIVANSRGGLDYWSGSKRPLQCLVPNAQPLELIGAAEPSLPAALNVSPSTRVILFAGRLTPEKNVVGLVEALADVTRDANTIAILCGEGPLEAAISSLIERLGATERVIMAGFIHNLWSVMKRADVLVSVSALEGQPNVVQEAMACGCPLVVSDIPAHREFLDSSTAIFVDRNDPGAIATGIRRVLSDQAGARSRADRAQLRVAQWAPTVVADAYDQVYAEIFSAALSRRPAPGRAVS